uniref:Piezo THU9 and anchor domain-containing protein n=1 Tax=Aegilops tauschii TaxID=37682 RepID=M8C8Y8_AEGTA
MQLYSYERRQNSDKNFSVSDASASGLLGFLRRLLIWHSEKILSVSVFYACLSSISLSGLVYLLGLIVFSTLPKVSRIPSKVYLLYTGLLAVSEYLFQMICKPAQMCPGQRLYGFAAFLGLKHYDSGLWGVEYGLRGKVLVIVACTIQYNVFHWLDLMPASLVHEVQGLVGSSLSSSLSSGNTYQTSEAVQNVTKGLDEDKRYSFAKMWGMSKESHKWDKQRIISLKRERFDTQKSTFKSYIIFWMENLFKLRGLIADDPRMLVSYYVVFIFSSFKLRSDHFSGFSDSDTYRQMRSQRKNAFVWRDLSLETKSFWTFLDYVRLYAYCHLLDIVLALIAITGTLEYDFLHLGYLGFALVFFRMRLEILKKKNKIFKYLRMYNFAVIVLSLAYQSPYVGQFSSGKCDQIDYLYEIIGFYKYDYGFKITSRSAFVEIVIFLLVAVQSYIFSSGEFDYVSRYLEAEQIGAMVREQEKKALKKTEQLQHLRRSEEQKRQRNMQVERMKSEMYNLQSQLNTMNSFTPINHASCNEGLRRRRTTRLYSDIDPPLLDNETGSPAAASQSFEFSVADTKRNIPDLLFPSSCDAPRSPIRGRSEEFMLADDAKNSVGSTSEIIELDECDIKLHPNLLKEEKERRQPKENPLKSAVQLIGDGVSQVQSFGNQAVTNIVSFLNIDPEESLSNEHPAEGSFYDVVENQRGTQDGQFLRTHSDSLGTATESSASMPVGVIFRYIWYQMRSNYDYVCYCCFILSSITAKDGEWVPVTEFSFLSARNNIEEKFCIPYNWKDRLKSLHMPLMNLIRMFGRGLSRYWLSLTQGAESPPFFVQVTMEVKHWPEDGIQPERIESAINKVLVTAHEERCQSNSPSSCHSSSRVRIQSIERSKENPSMALAVLEVVYAAPTECQSAGWFKSLTPAADVEREIHDSQKAGLFEEINFPYPVVSVIGGGKREIDLYAYYFGADMAVFFLVLMFYQSILKNKSEFLEVYQLEEQFPKEFVFILMILFFLIVVDRIIYLWSFATGKVVFYIFNLVLFTYSVTEYAWGMELAHRDVGGIVLRAIYLTKSISLALQALQIRYGIPNKSNLYRQFLTSKVTQVNYLGFRLYRALPFLYELRCVLDWSCTTTSLTMYDWLKASEV